MPVDVERLRIERHVGEQHVVHLRDRPRERMLVEVADHEVVEIDAAALVANHGLLSHRRPPSGAFVNTPFTIIVNSWNQPAPRGSRGFPWRSTYPRSSARAPRQPSPAPYAGPRT